MKATDKLVKSYVNRVGVTMNINDEATAVRFAQRVWAAGLHTVMAPKRFAGWVAVRWGEATDATAQEVEQMRRDLAAMLDPDREVPERYAEDPNDFGNTDGTDADSA